MGMFDNFIINEVCPCCGAELKEIQSKQFQCDMSEYKINDEIDFDEGTMIVSGWVTERIYCDTKGCNVGDEYSARIYINGGRFVNYEIKDKEERFGWSVWD